MEAGVRRRLLEDSSCAVVPPAGAGSERATWHMPELPVVEQEVIVTDRTLFLTVIVALFFTAPSVAWMMVHPFRVGVVVKVAVPLIAPAGIVRLAGICRLTLVD